MLAIIFLSFNFFGFIQNRECFGISGKFCCDGYLLNQTTGYCQKCPIGYYLNNCSKVCSPPYYGEGCQSVCQCPNKDCHFAIGCLQHVKTVTGYQRLNLSEGNTTQHTTLSFTVTTTFSTVSYSTEDHNFSASVRTHDVTQMTYSPTEVNLLKADILVHLVQVILSLIGVCVIVFTIFVITYIYLKCFRKTSNESGMKEKHTDARYDPLSFGADDPECPIQREPEEQVSADCTYLTPVFRRSDNSDTCFSDKIEESFKEIPLNRQNDRSNLTSDVKPTNVCIEISQGNIES